MLLIAACILLAFWSPGHRCQVVFVRSQARVAPASVAPAGGANVSVPVVANVSVPVVANVSIPALPTRQTNVSVIAPKTTVVVVPKLTPKAPVTPSNRITLLHYNDWHNRVEPMMDWDCRRCLPKDDKEGRCGGGIARMKAFIDNERRLDPDLLLLDAGDNLHGTMWDKKYDISMPAQFMNALQPDAMVIGNHEFDYGIDRLSRYTSLLQHPVLSCNMEFNGHVLEQRVSKYIKKLVNGRELCIFGLTTTDVDTRSSRPLKIKWEIEAGKKCVKEMKDSGCKTIILLSHLGYTADIYAAKNIPDIDLIVGGHSHSFLWSSGSPPAYSSGGKKNTDHVWGPYPTWVDAFGRKIPVVQAFWGSRYIGKAVLELNSKGNIIKVEGRPVLLGGLNSENPVSEDPAMKAEVLKKKYWKD